jgi:hypothetical protein
MIAIGGRGGTRTATGLAGTRMMIGAEIVHRACSIRTEVVMRCAIATAKTAKSGAGTMIEMTRQSGIVRMRRLGGATAAMKGAHPGVAMTGMEIG